MGEVENLKLEIIHLKQLLVGYQECMKQCGYFQNLSLSLQIQLKACHEQLHTSQTQLRSAQVSAKMNESKYNVALELAGTQMSKKRKLDAPLQELPAAAPRATASVADRAFDTTKAPTATEEHPPNNKKKLPTAKNSSPRILATAEQPPAEKKKRAPAAPPIPSFEECFEQLEYFKAGHGHCNISRGGGFKQLGTWVAMIRRKYAEKQAQRPPGGGFDKFYLTDERIKKLESIGFQWRIKSTQPISFATRLDQLRKFKDETGHCIVPQKHKTLGDWVHNIRGEYRRKRGLDEARQKPLDDLGFAFEPLRKIPTFEERLEQCADWRRRHGHLAVPNLRRGRKGDTEKVVLTEAEKGFRRWAAKMRDNYRFLHRGDKSREVLLASVSN